MTPTPPPLPNSLQLSRESPWPGLRSFEESAQAFFFGRQAEIDALFRLVRRERLVVFYGRSGLGKTSLLQAGLFPQLRAAALLPVLIRLEHHNAAPHPIAQIKHAITTALRLHGIDAPPPRPDETLWEYSHRAEIDFWDTQNRLVTLVLVLDQFEERFTLAQQTPEADVRAAETLAELSQLVENRTPPALQRRFETEPSAVEQFDFSKQACKVVLSLREDFLPELEGLRDHFPGVVENRFRLQGMSMAQALDVILKPGGHLVSEVTAREIVTFVAGLQPGQIADAVVEPVLLSVVLYELNQRRREARHPQISSDLLSGSREQILEGFYASALAGLPAAVRLLVEEGLLTSTGRRDSLAWEDALAEYHVDEASLQVLINRHLVRREDRAGGSRLELVHDRIAEVVAASRNRRRVETAREVERRQQAELRRRLIRSRINAAIGTATALVLGGVILFYWLGFVRPSVSYARGFDKLFGQPAPQGVLSRNAVNHRSWSLRFIRKGYFGPVLAVEAVDSTGQLTTRHSIGTYLNNSRVRTERAKECRWEFVYDERGRVVYEVGRDRFGRMVWGFVYAPAQDESTEVRHVARATFVGPDGLPRPQASSRAEFLEITYDDAGHEVRHRYLDREGRPVTGLDGAFGRSFVYDERGREVEIISLDQEGRATNDEAGNASLRLEYDDDDRVTANTAFDALGGRTLFNTGRYWRGQTSYDQWGNAIEFAVFDTEGDPTTNATTNAHRHVYEYDSRGNEIEASYFNAAGEAVTGKYGNLNVHRVTRRFDEHNRLISERYYDEDDIAIAPDGYHELRIAYDERGFASEYTYFDEDDEPMEDENGIHRLVFVNDEFGQTLERRYFDLLGDPTLSESSGLHFERNRYDKNGNLVEYAGFGFNGEPLAHDQTGVHRTLRAFDMFGNQLLEEYFDAGGGRINSGQGFHRSVSEYDHYGALVRRAFFDASLAPVPGPDGAPQERYAYDANGVLSELWFLGSGGEPAVDHRGIHHIVLQHNAKRQQTLWQCFGPNEEPVNDADGIHIYRSEYDAVGRTVRSVRLNRDGGGMYDPRLGIATYAVKFDPQGYIIEQAYFKPDGAPALSEFGFARLQINRDHEAGRVERIAYGPDDRVMFDEIYAYARSVEVYRDGELIEQTWHGVDGGLINGPHGYAMLRKQVDSEGEIVREEFLGSDEKPAWGTGGYHRREQSPDGQFVYWDSANRVMPEPDESTLLPLIYVRSIKSRHTAGFAAGLRPGDLLWQLGEWNFPDALEKAKAAESSAGDIARHMWAAFEAERRELGAGRGVLTVLRNGRPETLILIDTPEDGFALDFAARYLPASEMPAWIASVPHE